MEGDSGETAVDDSEPAGNGDRFRSGVVLAICGTFLFAVKSIFIKLAFAEGATPILLLSIRMLFALPFYAFVLYRVRWSSDAQPLPLSLLLQTMALGFLGYYLSAFLDLCGLEYISAQLERLTLFSYPTIVAVLAWMFLGEQLNFRVIAAITLCYAGVFLMYGQERLLVNGANTERGMLLVAGAALSYSIYTVFAKSTMKRMGSRQFTSLAMIGSTCFVAGHAVWTQQLNNIGDIKPIVYLYGLIMAFACTVVPSFMINEAILRIGATRTSVIGTVGPVLTMLLAIAVLREPSTALHFAGMGIAISGVSLVGRK